MGDVQTGDVSSRGSPRRRFDVRTGDLRFRSGVRLCQLHLQYFANLFFQTPQIAYFIVLLY